MAIELWITKKELKNYISSIKIDTKETKYHRYKIDEKLAKIIFNNLKPITNGNLLYFPVHKRTMSHSLSIRRDKALLLISLLYGTSLGYSKSNLTAYVNSNPYAETQTALGLYQDLLSDLQHRKAQVQPMSSLDNQGIFRLDTLIFPLTRTNRFPIIGFEVNNLTFDNILKPTLGAVRMTPTQILLKNAIIWHGNWIVFDEWGEFEIYTNEEFSNRFSVT